jgi:small subunit ribosomal protein S9
LDREIKSNNAPKQDDGDSTIGVDMDSDWNLKHDFPNVPADNLLEALNESYARDGTKRKRRSSGLGPPEPKVVIEDRDEYGRAFAKGTRKKAVAEVYIKKGNGEHFINGKPYTEYFPHLSLRRVFVDPFMAVDKLGEFDVYATVKGGGFTGQSGAIQLGISRALQKFDPLFRPPLRKGGFLTVDARRVERKKPGRKKARKLKQWVKR